MHQPELSSFRRRLTVARQSGDLYYPRRIAIALFQCKTNSGVARSLPGWDRCNKTPSSDPLAKCCTTGPQRCGFYLDRDGSASACPYQTDINFPLDIFPFLGCSKSGHQVVESLCVFHGVVKQG